MVGCITVEGIIGDTVFFARKGKESFLPGWSLGVVKEVEESSDLEVRVVLIKYAGEIMRKGNEKPKLKSGEIGPEISMRVTRRDSRSLIKLSVINIDIEDDLKNLSLWYKNQKFFQETMNNSSPGEQNEISFLAVLATQNNGFPVPHSKPPFPCDIYHEDGRPHLPNFKQADIWPEN